MADTLSAEQNTPPSDIELRLGGRMSDLRNSRGYTLDRLAADTGFTKGYLSKIENSKVIPPIGTLVKIAQALHTDLAELLGETNPEFNNDVCVVRSWERESVIRGGSSFGYDYVALANKRRSKQMAPFIMEFPSTIGHDVRFEHDGEEFLFVLEGQVEFSFTLEGRERQWILGPGDSIYFNSTTPHRGRSLKGESRALSVITRPLE